MPDIWVQYWQRQIMFTIKIKFLFEDAEGPARLSTDDNLLGDIIIISQTHSLFLVIFFWMNYFDVFRNFWVIVVTLSLISSLYRLFFCEWVILLRNSLIVTKGAKAWIKKLTSFYLSNPISRQRRIAHMSDYLSY
jgi:hypothetical protein